MKDQKKMNIRSVIFLLLLFPTVNYASTVYLAPICFGVVTNETSFSTIGRDGCNLPMIALRNAIIEKGHKCTVLTKNDIDSLDKECWFFVLDVPQDPEITKIITSYPKEKSVLIIGDPPCVLPYNYQPHLHEHYKKVFTHFSEIVDNKHYFKFYYPQPFLNVIDEVVPFNQKKLCTSIVGEHRSNHPYELYSARRNIISFFEQAHPTQFDFYGWGWQAHNHPCYRGTIADKLPFLKNYKFAICYENMRSQTYVTEKIFDILHAGCVPIYWGAQEITNIIPYRAYILREDFGSDEELYNYLNSMAEEEYTTYLAAAKEFFNSHAAEKFSIDSFANQMMKALFE